MYGVVRGLAVVAALACGCASAARVCPPPPSPVVMPAPVTCPPAAVSISTPVAPVASTPPPPPAPEPAPPAAFTQSVDAAQRAIVAADYPAADRALAAAATAAGDDAHLRFLAAYYRATRFAYAGDFDAAAAALLAVIPDLARHPDSSDEFWAHNTMMMIREAQGDPASALAENDQATLAAARGSWEPDDRQTLAYLKDRWHRAYLSRMLAETRSGSAKQGLVLYAQAALADYRERARKVGGYDDSVAVLEAYFAALDGKGSEARAAASRVDPAKDDDLEDLYLVVVGLEAGGDHAAAEAVRRQMRRSRAAHISRAIMLRWLDIDAKAPHDRKFTPWHP